MLTSTKQVVTAIAVTVALGMPLSPAFSATAASDTAVRNQDAPALRSGNLVRLRSGGPLMTVVGVEGDQVNCVWTDWNGQLESQVFPLDVLQMEWPHVHQEPKLLTNHLVDGVILTPGAVGTLPELQQAGFHYVK